MSDTDRDLRVSVVIATYNSGDPLRNTFGSLLRQSLPKDEFEVIFVDDGSTDHTHRYCQELAAEHPFVISDRIEHSGWPGRPRNVGLDRARGTYVLFMDHDDDLFPKALERMCRHADRHQADVLLAKEVVKGGVTVGWTTWKRDVDVVETIDQSVLQLLTPHKLYRRRFLLDQHVRFPEGKVRLEDYAFNAQAYVRAKRISILASYPCYRWIIHPGSARLQNFDRDVYWNSFRRSLGPVLTELPPGPLQDQFLVRWYHGKVLRRLKFIRFSPAISDALLSEVTDVLDLFPPALDRLLDPADRVRSALLRAGSRKALAALAEADSELTLDVTSCTVHRRAGRLKVRLRATLVDSDEVPLRFIRQPEGAITRAYPSAVIRELGTDLEDLSQHLGSAVLELSVRGQRTGVEWAVPAHGNARFVRAGSEHHLRMTLRADVDPTTAACGRRLGKDVWRVWLRAEVLGFRLRRRLTDPSSTRDGQQVPLLVPLASTKHRPARPAPRPLVLLSDWAKRLGRRTRPQRVRRVVARRLHQLRTRLRPSERDGES
jgi:poly(ribitol-phosphate) beta-N-acetylglucosaminyltransferase